MTFDPPPAAATAAAATNPLLPYFPARSLCVHAAAAAFVSPAPPTHLAPTLLCHGRVVVPATVSLPSLCRIPVGCKTFFVVVSEALSN